jgi:hypothetical protein
MARRRSGRSSRRGCRDNVSRPGWEASIANQRDDIADHLDDNPSLRPLLPQALATAYRKACREAVAETGLPGATFPETCPWAVEQALDGGFWPE